MTKIRIISDIHAEHTQGNFNMPVMDDEDNTILVIAGDLGVCNRTTTYRFILEDMLERFHTIVYIAGNHEHYGSALFRTHEKMQKNLNFEIGDDALRIQFGERFTYVHDNVAFICTTLWSDMDKGNPVTMNEAGTFMNDYSRIRIGSVEATGQNPYRKKLQPIHTMFEYNQNKKFIFDEIVKARINKQQVVVVTHHGPSYQSVHEKYIGDKLNGAYVSELYNPYTNDPMPDIHIHGHVHHAFDYMLGDTRVICNPRGYPGEPTTFNPELMVEL